MGQKVNPVGLRIGIVKDWEAQWYASKKDFSGNLIEDYKIRTALKKEYYKCGISKITISRISSTANIVIINMYTSRPGVLIGREGSGIATIKEKVKKIAPNRTISINVHEVKSPDTDAQLIAEDIALQLEKRTQFRRVMKNAIGKAMKTGKIKGIKTMVAGRLDGAEIARSEHYHEGSIPLQTLRADIDYATAEADTTFGKIGVKVWVYKGEVLSKATKDGGNN